ncbi:uncharacterized protein LOC144437273 [Glandiceps talaboti]
MSASHETMDSSDEDVFECGRCKEKFTSMDTFMVHKKSKQCQKNKNNSNSNTISQVVGLDVSNIPVPVVTVGTHMVSHIQDQRRHQSSSMVPHTATQDPGPHQNSSMVSHTATEEPTSMVTHTATRKAGLHRSSRVVPHTATHDLGPHQTSSTVLTESSFPKSMENQPSDPVAVKKGTFVQSLELRPPTQLKALIQAEMNTPGVNEMSRSDRSVSVDIIRQASIASGIEIADQFTDDQNTNKSESKPEETTVECTFCSVKIKTVGELQSHYSDVHNIAEQKAKQLAKEKQREINRAKLSSRRAKLAVKEHRKLTSHMCRVCNVSFKTAAKLTKHRKTKKHLDKKDQIQENKRSSRRKPEVMPDEDDYSEEQGPLKCASCDYETSEMRELRDHLTSHKKQSGKFTCNDCNLVFCSRRELANHSIAEHGKELRRPYKNRKVTCGDCGQQVQQRSLSKHKRTHAESKPELECPLCRHEASKESECETHVENHKVWVPVPNESSPNPLTTVPSGIIAVSAVPSIIGQVLPGSNQAVMTTGNPSSTIDLSSLGLEHIRTMQAAESLAQMCPENNVVVGVSDSKQHDETNISGNQSNLLISENSTDKTPKEDENCKDNNSEEKSGVKTKSDQLKCRECNTFHARSELAKHMRDKHRMIKMFLCREVSCRLTSTDLHEFCQHIMSHPSSVLFRCSCRKCLRKGNIDPGHKAELKKEKMRVYYQQMGFKCVKCWVKFPSQAGLDRHLVKESHNYPCPECDKVHVSKRQLRIHMITHQTERQYLCEKCGQDFKTPRDLQRHSISHSNIKPFQCMHCGKGFSFRNKLHRHILTVHTAVKPFTCSEPGCNKAFARKDKLVDHQRTHLSYEPFKCEFCQRGFFRKDNLKDHLVLHTGEFRFRCDICSKGFMRPKLLERHKKSEHSISEIEHHAIVDPTYQLCTIDGQSIACQELSIKDVNSQVQIQVKLAQ